MLNEKLNRIIEGLPSEDYEKELQLFQKCDMISDEEFSQILAYKNMQKREVLLNRHPSYEKIWKGSDGFWRTYVPDDTKPKGRRLIKKKEKKDLEDYLIKEIKRSEVVTIRDLFEEYIERKRQNEGIKPATITRYRSIFKRHYISSGWDKKDIRKIDAEEFSDWLEDQIGSKSLTSKALSNLKGITTGILRRALKRKLITYTSTYVYDLIDTRPRKTYKEDSTQIVTQEELKAFVKYIVDNQTVVNLSLLLMAVSGLRVGEMVTLRFEDFLSDTSFKVHSTETYYKNDNGEWIYEVSETPKTEAGIRTAFIPSEFSWVIKKLRNLNPFAEFVCTDKKGKRMRSQVLKQKMYQICKILPEFQDKKSTHKLRKTFCTILLDSGFDRNLIKSVMGHVDISTSENFYHFDRKTDSQKQEMMDNVVEFKRVVNI